MLERIIVLVNGIAGAVIGVCCGIALVMLLILGLHYEAQTIAGMYIELFGPQILGGIIGFYLAVRDDWWRMKREW